MSTAPDAPAVLLITHHVEELPRACRQIVLMRDGQIVTSGPMSKTLTEPRLTQTFGRTVHVDEHDGRYWARLR
ncbi:MAG: hypothetical protein QM770_22405 [Tepidisphaeraceae bacterium]